MNTIVKQTDEGYIEYRYTWRLNLESLGFLEAKLAGSHHLAAKIESNIMGELMDLYRYVREGKRVGDTIRKYELFLKLTGGRN